MSIFYVGLGAAVVVAVAYVILALRAFLRARRRALAGEVGVSELESGYEAQSRHFWWKAGSGVVVSTLLLVLASATPLSWYLFPALAIGSSVAVIVAFVLDARS